MTPLQPLRNALTRLNGRTSQSLKIAMPLLLGVSVLGHAQEEKLTTIAIPPTRIVHSMSPAAEMPDPGLSRVHPKLRVAPKNAVRANTGSGVVYTCDSSVSTATCNYLNTTVAGYYNSTFTDANANIYITYGNTGLGESEGYINLVKYSNYLTAVTNNTNKSSFQTSGLSALNSYDTSAYGSGNVGISVALGRALGFSGLTGITKTLGTCTPGASGCYDEIVTVVANPGAEGFSLYYDNLGGEEPANAYDYYAVVQHETDEVLGTSSCISTDNGALSDGCDFSGGNGVPSVVDLFRYSSPGHLELDSSLSQSSGQYFSYDGGVHYGAYGTADQPKVYNTLANGEDYADFVSSSPDCGSNEAIQDAVGCPGEDAGLTVLNDSESELVILNTIGFDIPASAPAKATMSSPSPGTTLTGTSVTFSWTTASGATGYAIWVGSTGAGSDNIYEGGVHNVTSLTVSGLPANGKTIYVRLWTSDNGTLSYNDYTYIEAASMIQGAITSPANGSTLSGSSVTFAWSAGSNNASGYALWVGTTGVGSHNIVEGGVHTALSSTVSGLPTTGGTVYVRLYTSFSGTLEYTDYTYTAAKQAVMASPAPGTTLSGATVTFTWTVGNSAATGYALWVGTTGVGSHNIVEGGVHNVSSYTVSGLPTTGGKVYVRLYTSFNGTLVYNDYTYTAK